MIKVDRTALLGAATAMKRVEADERKNIARVTRTTLTPAWQRLLRQKIVTAQQRKTFGAGRVSFSAGGKGQLVLTEGRGMSGVRERDMGKPAKYWMELVDYGSRRRYGQHWAAAPTLRRPHHQTIRASLLRVCGANVVVGVGRVSARHRCR